MKNLHQALRLANQKVRCLQAIVDKLIEEQAVHFQESDATDISRVVSDVSAVVEERFPPDTPQRIFWDQQMKYHRLKDKRQMRWHPLVVRFALNLKYLSSTAYRAVRESVIIQLPLLAHIVRLHSLGFTTQWRVAV